MASKDQKANGRRRFERVSTGVELLGVPPEWRHPCVVDFECGPDGRAEVVEGTDVVGLDRRERSRESVIFGADVDRLARLSVAEQLFGQPIVQLPVLLKHQQVTPSSAR